MVSFPRRRISPHICGTHATGWLKGAHPEEHEGKVKRQMLFQWSPNYRRWFSIFKCRTAVVTIYISSVGRILSNGVVFVTVAPTEKELNTNSQAHRMTTVHFLPNILQQLHYFFFCFVFKKLIAPSCFFVILLGSCSHQCTSTCIL